MLTLPAPAQKFYAEPPREPFKPMTVPEVQRYMRKYIFAYATVLVLGIGLIFVHLAVLSPPSPLLSIGGTFVASGLIGFAHYYHYQREKRIEFISELVDDWGLLDIHEGRGWAKVDEYRRLMQGCDKKLHIQAISLTRFQEDLGDELEKLGSHGVDIKLLLLDPDSEICSWYSEANPGRSGLEDQIRASVNQLQERNIDSMEIKFYDSIPLNYFRIDDNVFVGPYFTTRSSRRSVTFLAEVNKALAEGFEENFQKHWDDYGKSVKSRMKDAR